MSDIQDLVDNPREEETIELKRWLEFTSKATKAEIAKDVAALANFGGGYIVFGFDDVTKQPDQNIPADIERFYTNDFFNDAIVSKYLTPKFHCVVENNVLSALGNRHAVVIVPSHSVVPICAKKGGPQDAKKNPIGIMEGAYYTRSTKPESIQIRGHEMWEPIIRRCVLYDKERLLSDFNHLLDGKHDNTSSDISDRLNVWHQQCRERYIYLIKQASDENIWKQLILQNRYYHFSYKIAFDTSEVISISQFQRILEQVNIEVRQVVDTGWSMFYWFTREEIKPKYFAWSIEDEEIEGVETWLLEGASEISLPDFWRVSNHGFVTIIRPYREDRSELFKNTSHGVWLDPEALIQEVTELVCHARALTKHFPSAEKVLFQLEWMGLKGRHIRSLYHPSADYRHRECHQESRSVKSSWATSKVFADHEKIIAELAAPVGRLFDGFSISEELVLNMIPNFKRI